MSPASLFRFSGFAAILSGLFLIVDTLVIELFLPETALTNTVGYSGLVIGVFALIGVYFFQRTKIFFSANEIFFSANGYFFQRTVFFSAKCILFSERVFFSANSIFSANEASNTRITGILLSGPQQRKMHTEIGKAKTK